jgi:hypothetical protein
MIIPYEGVACFTVNTQYLKHLVDDAILCVNYIKAITVADTVDDTLADLLYENDKFSLIKKIFGYHKTFEQLLDDAKQLVHSTANDKIDFLIATQQSFVAIHKELNKPNSLYSINETDTKISVDLYENVVYYANLVTERNGVKEIDYPAIA